jgi:colanic acid biosynthesis glycosyl transferase WcaI
MRIAIITQLFLPEMGALPNRIYPIATQLASSGHEVYVVTGMPNYPTGVVFEGYKGKLFMKEELSGYTVLRTAYYTVRRNKSKWSQLFSYISLLPGVFWNGLRIGKIDAVLVTSPPIFLALPGMALAAWRRAKFIFDVRDLWPDEIIACGASPERSPWVWLLRALERLIYRRADHICCTTRPFVETVIGRGAQADRATYLPNGADLDLFRPLATNNAVASRFNWRNRFVVMYCGAFGIKHGVQTILAAAKLLEREKDLLFALVGGGACESDLRQYAERMHLTNVTFLGEQRVTDVPLLIAQADVCVSSLLPSPYLEKIISVKVFEYLACGKPVIGLHSGETARVLNESGAGIVVQPGDAAALAAAVRTLYGDPRLRAALGRQGRQYVERHYSRRAIAVRFESLLREKTPRLAEQAA